MVFPVVGAKVTWTSQASGNTKTKVGFVVMIVPPNRLPEVMWRDELHGDERKKYNKPVNVFSAAMRHEVSYVVAVPTKSGRGRPRIYWPLASKLSFEEGETSVKAKSKS